MVDINILRIGIIFFTCKFLMGAKALRGLYNVSRSSQMG